MMLDLAPNYYLLIKVISKKLMTHIPPDLIYVLNIRESNEIKTGEIYFHF
jgi:hypothetical protein